MNFPPSNLTPAELLKVENRFIFDYCTLKAALYGVPSSNGFPHNFLESRAHYEAPIFGDRTVQTPTHGMRFIINASILIHPMNGFNASGIWNHVQETSPNLIIP